MVISFSHIYICHFTFHVLLYQPISARSLNVGGLPGVGGGNSYFFVYKRVAGVFKIGPMDIFVFLWIPVGWQGGGGRVPPLTAKKWPKIGKKSGRRKGKNLEISFTLPLLTDRAGYATVEYYVLSSCNLAKIKGKWAWKCHFFLKQKNRRHRDWHYIKKGWSMEWQRSLKKEVIKATHTRIPPKNVRALPRNGLLHKSLTSKARAILQAIHLQIKSNYFCKFTCKFCTLLRVLNFWDALLNKK